MKKSTFTHEELHALKLFDNMIDQTFKMSFADYEQERLIDELLFPEEHARRAAQRKRRKSTEETKERSKQYYKEHKEEIKIRKAEYFQRNKERIKLQQREYRQNRILSTAV